MLQDTQSLRARHYEKQLRWQEMMVPEITRRLGATPDQPEDPRPNALVAAALACLDAASASAATSPAARNCRPPRARAMTTCAPANQTSPGTTRMPRTGWFRRWSRMRPTFGEQFV